jgi:predicted Zn finger-like uncharacterized protein
MRRISCECPSCSSRVAIPDDLLGKTVKCPLCNQVFVPSLCPENADVTGPCSQSARIKAGKWIFALACLALVVCTGLMILFLGIIIESSEPYHEALMRAQANPQVREALGAPIEPSHFLSGSGRGSLVARNHADLWIPIHGPKGKGEIHVKGQIAGVKWQYSVFEVLIHKEKRSIDLLKNGQ